MNLSIKKYIALIVMLACNQAYSAPWGYQVVIITHVGDPFYFGITTVGNCANHEGVMVHDATSPINVQRIQQEQAKGVSVYVGASDVIHIGGCLGTLTFRYPDNTEQSVSMNGVSSQYQVQVLRRDNGQYYCLVSNTIDENTLGMVEAGKEALTHEAH